MISISIADRSDDVYPFTKQLWDDFRVVYHGTWSVYSPRIESEGFGHAELPFDPEDIASVKRAREALDLGSHAQIFFGTTPGVGGSLLSMTGNFWGARVYATDGGGEAARLAIKDAKGFEAFCASAESRAAKRHQWEGALRQHPTHVPTRNALELLKNDPQMNALCREVQQARQRLESVTRGGFPVVYALQVEPEWFPASWEAYTHHWELGHRNAIELRCHRSLITPQRIVGKVMYLNGTDPDKQWDGAETWKELGLLPWDKDESAGVDPKENMGTGEMFPKTEP